MKEFLCLLFFITPIIGYSQDILSHSQTNKLEVGIRTTHLVYNRKQLAGLHLSFKNRDGLYIPVTLEFGSGVKSYTTGIGQKSKQSLLRNISYSINLALSKTIYDQSVDDILEIDKERLITFLQHEVSFHFTKKMSIGVFFDLDPISLGKSIIRHNEKTEEHLAQQGWNQVEEGGWLPPTNESFMQNQVYYPQYSTEAQKEYAVNSVKKTSKNGFGINLKIDLN